MSDILNGSNNILSASSGHRFVDIDATAGNVTYTGNFQGFIVWGSDATISFDKRTDHPDATDFTAKIVPAGSWPLSGKNITVAVGGKVTVIIQ